MYSYAQTNIQLFNQLRSEGYSNEELIRIRDAYELTMHLFTCLYRPSGDTFISHLVGTASILASLHVPVNVVAAGLLHAAYVHGDFGSSIKRISDAKRKQVRRAVGDDVEEYVARYTALRWNSQTIPTIRDSLDTLRQTDRDVLLMRLANELEDSLNLGVLYCPDAERRKQYIKSCGPIMVEMAERLGFPALASELARVFEETISTEILAELHNRSGRDRAYLIPPRSYRKRLTAAFSHLSVRVLSRSSKLFNRMTKMFKIFHNQP